LKLYRHKDINCGFIILCPEQKIALLQATVNSIKSRYPNSPYFCVTEQNASDEDISELNKICRCYRGKSTFSSLINCGMRHARSGWNFIVCAGAIVRPRMDIKFSYFIESEKDVLYPISENKTHFVEATLNGLLLNKNMWREVGEMEEEGDFEWVKTLWALSAIQNQVKFKAIANSKIC